MTDDSEKAVSGLKIVFYLTYAIILCVNFWTTPYGSIPIYAFFYMAIWTFLITLGVIGVICFILVIVAAMLN